MVTIILNNKGEQGMLMNLKSSLLSYYKSNFDLAITVGVDTKNNVLSFAQEEASGVDLYKIINKVIASKFIKEIRDLKFEEKLNQEYAQVA